MTGTGMSGCCRRPLLQYRRLPELLAVVTLQLDILGTKSSTRTHTCSSLRPIECLPSRAFERHTNKHAKAHTRPACTCTPAHLHIWQQGGPACLVQGHYALLPLTITHGKSIIRATDPLPCSSSRSHKQAIQSLSQLAATVKVQARSKSVLSKALPQSDWDHLPTLRQHVQNVAEQLSTVACIRVADKSSTMLFGFCRQWVWDETRRFLEGEGYESQAIHTSPGIMQALRRIIQQNKLTPPAPYHCCTCWVKPSH